MTRRLVRCFCRLTVLLAATGGDALAAQGTTGTLEGHVRDSVAARPIARARVAVRGTPLNAFTDSSGHYAIHGIPAGMYVVRVEAARSLTLELDSVPIHEGRVTRRDVKLRSAPARPVGDYVDGVPVVLNRLPARLQHQGQVLIDGHYTDRVPDSLPAARGVLRGVVRDAAHRVIRGARVTILGTDLVTTTDTAGRYRFEMVPAGRYDVRAAFPGHRVTEIQRLRVMSRQTVTQDFTLKAGTVEIDDPRR